MDEAERQGDAGESEGQSEGQGGSAGAEGGRGRDPKAPGTRLIGARREAFLAALGETGNVRIAAAEIGMDKRTLERMRKRDAALDRDWAAAVDAADRRLRAASAQFGGDPWEMIKRGPSGRLQIVAVRAGGWTGKVEDRFFDLLRRTGNVSASARALGFAANYVWERRRQWPDFARRWEEALEDSEIELEFRLVKLGNNVPPAPACVAAGESEPAPEPPFDPEFALKFLKWREEKRAGRGRRGNGHRYGPREPTIEEVRDEIVRRVAAIRRHRAARAADGGSQGQ